jgi:hypothetical protein
MEQYDEHVLAWRLYRFFASLWATDIERPDIYAAERE